ncbi:SMC-Scp complex subunit ScpB [Candidatus Bathyarchaeota archaeon B24-2]|nr:MAG: SMC-Scp complex subunit ScpB [Candidatus Bathyarchaeota archaeon B24-2]
MSKRGRGSRDERERKAIKLIEAALYVSGRPLDLKTLGSVSGLRSKRTLTKLIKQLKESYANRESAIEIVELEDGRYVMQLKTEYTAKVRKLAVRPLLTTGPLKTLSYIAFRQPVSQSQVVAVRGTHAYAHIKELERMGLIRRKKEGRESIITTTEFFSDYFGLSRHLPKLKEQLKKILFGKEDSKLTP